MKKPMRRGLEALPWLALPWLALPWILGGLLVFAGKLMLTAYTAKPCPDPSDAFVMAHLRVDLRMRQEAYVEGYNLGMRVASQPKFLTCTACTKLAHPGPHLDRYELEGQP